MLQAAFKMDEKRKHSAREATRQERTNAHKAQFPSRTRGKLQIGNCCRHFEHTASAVSRCTRTIDSVAVSRRLLADADRTTAAQSVLRAVDRRSHSSLIRLLAECRSWTTGKEATDSNELGATKSHNRERMQSLSQPMTNSCSRFVSNRESAAHPCQGRSQRTSAADRCNCTTIS